MIPTADKNFVDIISSCTYLVYSKRGLHGRKPLCACVGGVGKADSFSSFAYCMGMVAPEINYILKLFLQIFPPAFFSYIQKFHLPFYQQIIFLQSIQKYFYQYHNTINQSSLHLLLFL